MRVGTPEGPAEMEVAGLLWILGNSFGGLAFGLAPLPYAQEVFDEPGNITGSPSRRRTTRRWMAFRRALPGRSGRGSETRTAQAGAQFQSF